MGNNFLYFNYLNEETNYYEKKSHKKNIKEYFVKELPHDWSIITDDNSSWKFYVPLNKNLLDQGWKIHISANLDNAQEILNVVSNILFEKKIHFKHINNKGSLYSMNSKNGNRISSGKFITIYPDDSIFVELLNSLYEALKLFDRGPYILSDKCWKDSNIYYRYGAFKKMYSKNGELCIKDSDGNLIPDNRTPYYRIPKFVKEPKELEINNKIDSITNSSDKQSNESRINCYNFKKSIRFNNGGGIYLAERKKDKQKVIIKEARFKVGLDGNNKDALERMQVEYNSLMELKDVKGVVKILDYFKAWEHSFLVEEYIEGLNLTQWVAMNYPFHSNEDVESYSKDIIQIIQNLKQIIVSIHDKNIGMGDLQPSNIIINENLDVTLIDFEAANHKDISEKQSLITIGFGNTLNKNNEERDWYGLKKVLRYCVLPIGPVSELNEKIINYHNLWILRNFGNELYNFVKETECECDSHLSKTKETYYLNNFEEIITKNIITEHDIIEIRDCLRDGIISNCSERDSLIQGDIRQHEIIGGNVNVLTGGFGAILALNRSGEVNEIAMNWVKNYLSQSDHEDVPHGLFTGKAGIASVLYEIGFKTEAINIFNSFNDNYDLNDVSLRSGLAGIGLSLAFLYLDTKNNKYLQETLVIANHIKEFIKEDIELAVQDWSGIPIGIIDGWSGVSIFFSTLYMITGDIDYYNLSRDLISKDLSKCQKQDDINILQTLDNKNRLLPYLSGGSIGIGIAIWYFNKISNKNLFNKELDLIINTNKIRCSYNVGLFDGIGGFLNIPSIIDNENYVLKSNSTTIAIDRLKLYLINDYDKLLCPGNFSYKLSSDIYSGSSGIVLALQGILNNNPLCWLPLININIINFD